MIMCSTSDLLLVGELDSHHHRGIRTEQNAGNKAERRYRIDVKPVLLVVFVVAAASGTTTSFLGRATRLGRGNLFRSFGGLFFLCLSHYNSY